MYYNIIITIIIITNNSINKSPTKPCKKGKCFLNFYRQIIGEATACGSKLENHHTPNLNPLKKTIHNKNKISINRPLPEL